MKRTLPSPFPLAAALLLFLAQPAAAAFYQLIAQAGGDDDVSESEDDASAIADYYNPGLGGSESYSASAGSGGGLDAHAETHGVPPFAAINRRSAARIEETIRLLPPPFPDGPVTFTVGFSADVSAAGEGGNTATASAQVQLEPNSMSCSATTSTTSGPGGTCAGGEVSGMSVTRTFTLQELSNRGWEIDVAAQVEARTELVAQGGNAIAQANGGLWARVSGGGVTQYYWTGTTTVIPTPEPAAGAGGLVALAALARLVRSRDES